MMNATNELGLKVKFLDTAWIDNRVTVAQVWPTRERPTTLTLEMGVSRTVSTEFYVRPDRVRLRTKRTTRTWVMSDSALEAHYH